MEKLDEQGDDEMLFERAQEVDLELDILRNSKEKSRQHSENMKTEDGQEEKINHHLMHPKKLQRPQQLEEPDDLLDLEVEVNDLEDRTNKS